MKLSDLDKSERSRAKVNSKGEVLCLMCEKNPARVSEYGMLRKCIECEKERFGPMVVCDDQCGRKTR